MGGAACSRATSFAEVEGDGLPDEKREQGSPQLHSTDADVSSTNGRKQDQMWIACKPVKVLL